MATTTLPNESPSFARLTGGGHTSSWMLAVPATFLLVALIAGAAWLASAFQTKTSRLMVAERELASQQKLTEQAQKQTSLLQGEVDQGKSPGSTTVVLQATVPPVTDQKGKKGKLVAKADPSSAWGAAVWGEDGTKSWIRLRAYGLKPLADGLAYMVWFEPRTGAPIAAGKLDPSPTGAAFSEAKDLPGVDQGKRLFVALEKDSAKAPAGQVLFEAELPKLASASAAVDTVAAKTDASATDKAAPADGAKAAPTGDAKAAPADKPAQ